MKRVLSILCGMLLLFVVGGCGSLQSVSEPKLPDNLVKKPVFKINETIQPKAIVLHWWASWGNGDINVLIRALRNNQTRFNPKLRSTDHRPYFTHTTVQIGVTKDGTAYQLTSRLDSFARHATCANWWAIGIEIEGGGPKSGHYIGDNRQQLAGVVKIVRYLVEKYDIPLVSVVGPRAKTGKGILSHAMVDKKCTWADGASASSNKPDVDKPYLDKVLKALKS